MGGSKKGDWLRTDYYFRRVFFLEMETDGEGALVNHYSHTLFQLSMNGSVVK